MTGTKDSQPSAEFKARMLAVARTKASPPRRVARFWQIAMLGGAFLIAVVPYIVFFHVLPDFISPTLTGRDLAHGLTREVPNGLLEWTSGGSFLLAMIVVWLALNRGHSMLGRTSAFLLSVVIFTPVVLFAWRYGWSLHFDWTFTWAGRSWWGWKCLSVSLATALSPMAAFLTLRQGSDPNHPAATGAAMGVSAGACSWVLVDMRCPVGAPLHLLIGHVLPIVILGIAGAILGRWLLAVRPVRDPR